MATEAEEKQVSLGSWKPRRGIYQGEDAVDGFCVGPSYFVRSFSAMVRSGLGTQSCLLQWVSNSKKGHRLIPQ